MRYLTSSLRDIVISFASHRIALPNQLRICRTHVPCRSLLQYMKQLEQRLSGRQNRVLFFVFAQHCAASSMDVTGTAGTIRRRAVAAYQSSAKSVNCQPHGHFQNRTYFDIFCLPVLFPCTASATFRQNFWDFCWHCVGTSSQISTARHATLAQRALHHHLTLRIIDARTCRHKVWMNPIDTIL